DEAFFARPRAAGVSAGFGEPFAARSRAAACVFAGSAVAFFDARSVAPVVFVARPRSVRRGDGALPRASALVSFVELALPALAGAAFPRTGSTASALAGLARPFGEALARARFFTGSAAVSSPRLRASSAAAFFGLFLLAINQTSRLPRRDRRQLRACPRCLLALPIAKLRRRQAASRVGARRCRGTRPNQGRQRHWPRASHRPTWPHWCSTPRKHPGSRRRRRSAASGHRRWPAARRSPPACHPGQTPRPPRPPPGRDPPPLPPSPPARPRSDRAARAETAASCGGGSSRAAPRT